MAGESEATLVVRPAETALDRTALLIGSEPAAVIGDAVCCEVSLDRDPSSAWSAPTGEDAGRVTALRNCDAGASWRVRSSPTETTARCSAPFGSTASRCWAPAERRSIDETSRRAANGVLADGRAVSGDGRVLFDGELVDGELVDDPGSGGSWPLLCKNARRASSRDALGGLRRVSAARSASGADELRRPAPVPESAIPEWATVGSESGRRSANRSGATLAVGCGAAPTAMPPGEVDGPAHVRPWRRGVSGSPRWIERLTVGAAAAATALPPMALVAKAGDATADEATADGAAPGGGSLPPASINRFSASSLLPGLITASCDAAGTAPGMGADVRERWATELAAPIDATSIAESSGHGQ